MRYVALVDERQACGSMLGSIISIWPDVRAAERARKDFNETCYRLGVEHVPTRIVELKHRLAERDLITKSDLLGPAFLEPKSELDLQITKLRREFGRSTLQNLQCRISGSVRTCN